MAAATTTKAVIILVIVVVAKLGVGCLLREDVKGC